MMKRRFSILMMAGLALVQSCSHDETGSDQGGDHGDDAIIYTDLSAEGTANCYLISEAGDYKFKAVQGNTDVTVGDVNSVEVLWESFGTDVTPKAGDLIDSPTYKDGYISFKTPETFAQGNAVIAAKDSEGVILWSWHIWCSKEGWKEQEYYNNAGTMMDRNLGATSATPGEVGALGLLYQWGRKDPFLGSSSITESTDAASTGTWNVDSDGSTTKAQENPMTFYTSLYLPNESWQSQKTAYDPCPVGWRVPDGGGEGVWAKAFGSSYFQASFDGNNKGFNFSSKFGDSKMIWYPASGCRNCDSGELYLVSNYGYYWSCSAFGSNYAYYLNFNNSNNVNLENYTHRSYGKSIRCLKEK